MALCLWATAIAVVDLRQRRIGNLSLLPGLGIAVAWLLYAPPQGLAGAAYGAVAALAALLPAWWLRVMGGGDVKLAVVLALIDPDALLLALIIAILAALGLGLARRARGGRPGPLALTGIPFAPLLVPPFLLLVGLRLFG
ncbi:prepilin peptidase [Rhodovarius crocodyli]|uniref:prepilin peptidase n=1 Tax=Rhodovarius crocodyli TaxID=1979269 RepID=UPI0038D0E0BC